ncbi:MAG: hypothetical protein ACC655_10910, partial [Rhodothermia bacterium]
MHASKPPKWRFAGAYGRRILAVGTLLASLLTVATNKRKIVLFSMTPDLRLLLLVSLMLVVGQVKAQSDLRVVGAPILVAGGEGAYFMNPRWA